MPAAPNEFVSLVWPVPSTPSALIDGQLVWAGCGSDASSCERLLLFTNVTLCPTVIETELGLTVPLLPTVMVAPLGPGPLPDGVVGPPLPPPSSPPQATNSERPRAAAASRQVFPVNCAYEPPKMRRGQQWRAAGRPRLSGAVMDVDLVVSCGPDRQKNLRVMLKPMNQVSSPRPPRASCPSVVPMPLETFT